MFIIKNKKLKIAVTIFEWAVIIWCVWFVWIYSAYRIRGLRYYNSGNYEKALELFLIESKLRNNEKVSNNIALCYKHLGNFTEEEKWRNKSLKYNPKFEKVIVNLADCYEAQGEIKKAIAEWKKYLELYPQYSNLYEKIIFLYLYDRDFSGAKSFVDECNSKNRGKYIPDYCNDLFRPDNDPHKSPVIISIISANIKDKVPLTYRVDMKDNVEKLYCWSIVNGYTRPSAIKHVWYFNDEKVAEVKLAVKPGYYRTWSSKEVGNNKNGVWEVVILNEDGYEVGFGNTYFRTGKKKL